MLMALGDILQDVGRFTWRDWVYVRDLDIFAARSECLVLDPDEAELGSDAYGIDIGKSVFHVVAANRDGAVIQRPSLRVRRCNPFSIWHQTF